MATNSHRQPMVLGKAAGAAWSPAVGLLGSLIVLLPFGWPPWLAALVGLVITVAVALTLTVLHARMSSEQPPEKLPPSSPFGSAIRVRRGKGINLHGNIVKRGRLLDAEDVTDLSATDNLTIDPPPDELTK